MQNDLKLRTICFRSERVLNKNFQPVGNATRFEFVSLFYCSILRTREAHKLDTCTWQSRDFNDIRVEKNSSFAETS